MAATARGTLTLHANTAKELGVIGIPLTYASALEGPDRQHRVKANDAEMVRLVVTSSTLTFSNKPPDGYLGTTIHGFATNAKDGATQYRVRGTTMETATTQFPSQSTQQL
jgi:hypothetical protein